LEACYLYWISQWISNVYTLGLQTWLWLWQVRLLSGRLQILQTRRRRRRQWSWVGHIWEESWWAGERCVLACYLSSLLAYFSIWKLILLVFWSVSALRLHAHSWGSSWNITSNVGITVKLITRLCWWCLFPFTEHNGQGWGVECERISKII
jgi:hypothetical protein